MFAEKLFQSVLGERASEDEGNGNGIVSPRFGIRNEYLERPFHNVRVQDQEIGEFYVAQERRATDTLMHQSCERVGRDVLCGSSS